MLVRDGMTKLVLLIGPAHTLREAARLMSARRVGAAVVTGIAGPDGGTPEKPVGTVWLAAAAGANIRAVQRIFPGDRGEIRARGAQAGLDLLRRLLLEP